MNLVQFTYNKLMFLSKYLLIIKAGKIFEETAETSYVQNTKFQDQNLILLIILLLLSLLDHNFLQKYWIEITYYIQNFPVIWDETMFMSVFVCVKCVCVCETSFWSGPKNICFSKPEQPSMVIFGSLNQLFCYYNFDLLFVCFEIYLQSWPKCGKRTKKVEVFLLSLLS